MCIFQYLYVKISRNRKIRPPPNREIIQNHFSQFIEKHDFFEEGLKLGAEFAIILLKKSPFWRQLCLIR